MVALVTGASSGIGYDMAGYLSRKGYDIIAVGRNRDRLEQLKQTLNTKVTIVETDLSDPENCKELYFRTRQMKVDILINDAGFGDLGTFTDTNLDKELSMIGTNVTAVHILTKLFLQDMKKRDSGYILNVASIAAFMPGPLMATYYATKAYVLRLTEAIREELKKSGSHVSVSVLCPGPVATRFDQVANVEFHLRAKSSDWVAKKAIDQMLQGKMVILPGVDIKLARFACKFVPDRLLAAVAHHMQSKKQGN